MIKDNTLLIIPNHLKQSILLKFSNVLQNIKVITIKEFLKDENGAGVVELILILVVLIGIVLIFKDQITDLVYDIFDTIFDEADKV